MQKSCDAMRIVITGSPGTGKTVIAKLLAEKMNLELIALKKVVEDNNLLEGIEVDISSLKEKLQFLDDDYVVEGHLACEMSIPADFVFVLRTDPDILKQRFAERDYPDKKTKENLMAEMLDYCTQRAEKNYGTVLELDTSNRTIDECVQEIERAVKNNKKKLDSVDYSDYLSRTLGIDYEGRKEND